MAGQWPQNGRDQVRLDCSQGTQKSPGLVPALSFLSLFSFNSLSFLFLCLSTQSNFFCFLVLFLFFRSSPSLPPSLSFIFLCFNSLLPCMLLLHRGLTLFPLFHHSTILSIFFFHCLFSFSRFSSSLSSFLFFSSRFIVARPCPDLG